MKLRKILAVFLAIMLAVCVGNTYGASAAGADSSEASAEEPTAENPYAPTETVEFDGVSFGRATAAYNETTVNNSGQENTTVYEGMPLFDGNEEHLDTFVDLIMSEMGDAGAIAIAGGATAKGKYTKADGSEGEYKVISNVSSFGADVGLDGETQWPNQMALAQTWNKDLVYKAGATFGNEGRSKYPVNTISGSLRASAHTGLIDLRSNPLAGRYDEGFGEDAYLVATLSTLWGNGIAGRTDEDDLYYRAMEKTKHFTNYNSEFFRVTGNFEISARAFYEYMGAAAEKAFETGAIIGYMSSYGMTNGVPSTSSFIHKWAQDVAKDGLVNGFDAYADSAYTKVHGKVYAMAFGNWLDEYYSSTMADQNALLIMAGHSPGNNYASSYTGEVESKLDTVNEALKYGLLGMTIEHIYKLARPYIYVAVKAGAYDERGADGNPLYWPFVDNAAGGAAASNHTTAADQETEYQAAVESIVLLKNDGALPLVKDSAVDLYGTMAEVFQYGCYSSIIRDSVIGDDGNPVTRFSDDADSYDNEENGWEAAISAKQALEKTTATNAKTYDTMEVVTIQNAAGKYLTTDEEGNLSFEDEQTDYSLFYLETWGQDAYSFCSVKTGKWVNGQFGQPSYMDSFLIYSDQITCTYEAPFKYYGLQASVSGGDNGFPDFFELISVDDRDASYDTTKESATYYIKAGTKANATDFGFVNNIPDVAGWYLQTKDDAVTVFTDGITVYGMPGMNNPEGMYEPPATSNYAEAEAAIAGGSADFEFTITTVAEAGANAEVTGDTAVVVVGQPYNGIAGEGVDRHYLDLGENMAVMASNIAKIYKEAGKNTVVIIKADFPVIAEALENDDNVDAILFWPLGGQYEAEALVDILFGDAAPSGRLVSSWYKSGDSLPAIDPYIFAGQASAMRDGYVFLHTDDTDATIQYEDVDTKYNTTSADLQQTGLTYMYADPAEMTYSFGYGLGYTEFAFADMAVNGANADDPFTVTVNVTNTGDTDGAEVVQVYIANEGSAYGDAVPTRKLVSFEKVEIAAGQTEAVTLTVDPEDFAVWDVNDEEKVVESGSYIICVSDSSALDSANTLKETITIDGDEIATLEAAEAGEINVWEHIFDSENVTYREYSKAVTAEAARSDEIVDGTFSVLSKGEGAWAAIPKVDLTGVTSVTMRVASEADENTIELHLDSPDGELLASGSFGASGIARYLRYADDDSYYTATDENGMLIALKHGATLGALNQAALQFEYELDENGNYQYKLTEEELYVHELEFTDVDCEAAGDGVHDIYVVFNNADARIATLTFGA